MLLLLPSNPHYQPTRGATTKFSNIFIVWLPVAARLIFLVYYNARKTRSVLYFFLTPDAVNGDAKNASKPTTTSILHWTHVLYMYYCNDDFRIICICEIQCDSCMMMIALKVQNLWSTFGVAANKYINNHSGYKWLVFKQALWIELNWDFFCPLSWGKSDFDMQYDVQGGSESVQFTIININFCFMFSWILYIICCFLLYTKEHR